MSVRSGLITATCMLPASTCLEALNVAVETVGLEMASSVWVSMCPDYFSCDVICRPDSFTLQDEFQREK